MQKNNKKNVAENFTRRKTVSYEFIPGNINISVQNTNFNRITNFSFYNISSLKQVKKTAKTT